MEKLLVEIQNIIVELMEEVALGVLLMAVVLDSLVMSIQLSFAKSVLH